MQLMKLQGEYIIDKSLVLQKAYSLLCVFFANKEISRRSNPENESDTLKLLEKLFFEANASRLLLEVAISVRVLDDQMSRLPKADERKIRYEAGKLEVNKYDYGLWDELNLNIRDVCNKIIHSDVMEPHFSDGTEPNEFDFEFKYTGTNKSVDWRHLSGYVRLTGTKRGEKWYVLLDIEAFVKGVYVLLTKS